MWLRICRVTLNNIPGAASRSQKVQGVAVAKHTSEESLDRVPPWALRSDTFLTL